MAAPILGCAKVDSAGRVTPLGAKLAPDSVVTEQDVQDPSKLARMVGQALGGITMFLSRWYPRRIDFEDVTVGGAGALTTLEHGFGGRVRWWVVDWVDSGGGGTAFTLNTHASTTSNTLVLISFTLGLATIRVEEAG